MKLISVITPCYNEVENVGALNAAVNEQFAKMPEFRHEHVFIDNASTDGTQEVLRELAARDKRAKVILNCRNFGHIRSPFYGILQSQGDAVILMAADFQDPPEMIPMLVEKWREGNRIVVCQKTASEESRVFYMLRTLYYKVVARLSDVDLQENFTGFGIFDKHVVDILRTIDDPYPYLRGLISEVGAPPLKLAFLQPVRRRGITKNNFYTLYDIAMLGLTKHTRVPLRLATMAGFVFASLSFVVGVIYLFYKLLFWDSFPLGMAPVVIGLFLFSSVQLFFIGVLGEYIGMIAVHVRKLPLVIERERINF